MVPTEDEIETRFVPFLVAWVCKTHTISSVKGTVSWFHGAAVPEIPIDKYINRFFRHTKCSDTILLLAAIYLKRVSETKNAPGIDQYSIHRLVFCALMIANKFHDDVPFDHNYLHKIAGLPKQELSNLERLFLILIDYKLYVKPTEFDTICSNYTAF